MFTLKNYVKVQSLEEAYELNQAKTAVVLGGMMWLRFSARNYSTAIDLSGLGLNTIEENDKEFSLGAMVTLRQLELHEGINAYSRGAVKEALQDIVGVQFRNGATLGGSLFGRFGFSDVLTVFLAMDSYVELYKGGIIPLSDFARMPRDNDILVRLIIKKTPGRFHYSAMRITRTDFPVLTCAVSEKNGHCIAVVGARPARARVITDETGLLNEGITEASAKAFASYAAASLPFGSNSRGSAKYRAHLASVLIERGLLALEKGKEEA